MSGAAAMPARPPIAATLLLLALAACLVEDFDGEVWRDAPERRPRMVHALLADLEREPRSSSELVALLGEATPCYESPRNLCWNVGRMRNGGISLDHWSLELQVDAEGDARSVGLVMSADPRGPRTRKRDQLRRVFSLRD